LKQSIFYKDKCFIYSEISQMTKFIFRPQFLIQSILDLQAWCTSRIRHCYW